MTALVRTAAVATGLVVGLFVGGCNGTGTGGGGGTAPDLPQRELLVTNLGANSIVGFELDNSGQIITPPFRVIRGGATGLHNPMAVSASRDDRIFVANLGDTSSGGPSVTIYDPAADGNVAPLRTIQGAVTGLAKPNAIAVGGWPGILVTNHVDVASGGTLGVIEFSFTAGQDRPTGGISGNNTTIAGPIGLGRDLQKQIFVAEPASNRILGWQARGATQNNDSPDFVIAGSATLLDQPMGVAFDGVGNMYVVNKGNSSITVYAPNPNGNVAPLRRIGGPSAGNTQLIEPAAIVVSEAGRVFVTQTNIVLAFAPGANGNVAPSQFISDPELSGTMGLAIR